MRRKKLKVIKREKWANFNNHSCKNCGNLLEHENKTELLDPNTEYGRKTLGFKKISVKLDNIFYFGKFDYEYTRNIFNCSKCKTTFSIDEQFEYELFLKKYKNSKISLKEFTVKRKKRALRFKLFLLFVIIVCTIISLFL